MVRAWYMNDNESEDKRTERHLSPPQFLTLDEVKDKTGVLYWKIQADGFEENEALKKIREERGYTYTDFCEIKRDTMPDYDAKLKMFYTEHLHADEEIRFVLNGAGYFDVRDRNDQWIRIEVCKDDLIVLPSGIYHRFTLDLKDYIKVLRLFVGEPVWTAINRPADNHPARASYLQTFCKKTFAKA